VLEQALQTGAEAIVVACPLCHQNLDLRQGQINAAFGTHFNVPILYLTQVIGLAIGISPEELLLQKHAVDPRPLIERVVREAVPYRAEQARAAAERAAREQAREAARQAKAQRKAADSEAEGRSAEAAE
jgi:heterodisulfide reductase subunit B